MGLRSVEAGGNGFLRHRGPAKDALSPQSLQRLENDGDVRPRTRYPRRALSALRMTAISMASWIRAPSTGVR
jgi:hypothetical protein